MFICTGRTRFVDITNQLSAFLHPVPLQLMSPFDKPMSKSVPLLPKFLAARTPVASPAPSPSVSPMSLSPLRLPEQELELSASDKRRTSISTGSIPPSCFNLCGLRSSLPVYNQHPIPQPGDNKVQLVNLFREPQIWLKPKAQTVHPFDAQPDDRPQSMHVPRFSR